MNKMRAGLLLGCVAAAVACVPRREPPPPQPQPQPQTRVPPRPEPPVPPPPRADWRDVPLTPGGWIYRNEGAASVALFGPAAGQASFTLRCDRATRQVRLSRQGAATGNMTIRTSYTARNFPLAADPQAPAFASATLAANDRFLDGMAFSRGRFTVELPGTPMLVIPAWPEPARVVEDCRS